MLILFHIPLFAVEILYFAKKKKIEIYLGVMIWFESIFNKKNIQTKSLTIQFGSVFTIFKKDKT